MEKVIVFAVLSIPLLVISFRSLRKPGSHGFYRFFGWEGILWLTICNIRFWFDDPFCFRQIMAWIFLFYSLYLIIAGTIQLKQKGKSRQSRQDSTLFSFEKTTKLVETGLYRLIRHPLYGSLIFLALGIFLKQPSLILFLITFFSSVMFFLTARMDEKECIAYFGETYREYMKRTKMFIPYLF